MVQNGRSAENEDLRNLGSHKLEILEVQNGPIRASPPVEYSILTTLQSLNKMIYYNQLKECHSWTRGLCLFNNSIYEYSDL
jgi:hypothetical protein